MALTLVSKEEMLRQQAVKLGPGPWVTLDQPRITAFADCTEDQQFIHVDEEKAAQSPFGGTIAHGFLTLSMLVKMCEDNAMVPENIVMGINYGFNKVRFLAPVRAGKRVRAWVELVKVEEKERNRLLITQSISVEIEGEDTPALVAEWLSMVVVA